MKHFTRNSLSSLRPGFIKMLEKFQVVLLDPDLVTGKSLKFTEFLVMLMKLAWDDFCFVTWCIIMLDRSGIHDWSVLRSHENIPHYVKPPAALTLDTRQVRSMNSFCWCQFLIQPSASSAEIQSHQTWLCFSSLQLTSLDEPVPITASDFCS